MKTESRKAKEIFCELIRIAPPEEWDARLSDACGQDTSLCDRVRDLLHAHARSGSFLREPVIAPTETSAYEPVAEGPGTVIGPYKLLQQIGEGGFGVVFMAAQMQPVRRKVALKIIKPGMDSKEVIARFEAERQALALMDHPNIARVLDAGATSSGRPYFVMELVKGVSITEYCDKNQLSTEERLRLFVTVCRAVQHAHQKGVIHRDLKPSNVMITLHDGDPVPKVIDFGVSKALSQQLTEKTLFTAYGQMIGTPQYMSPEQAEMSGLDVDTRSDVYSLGVLLYELLTGGTPFESERLRTAGYAEMQRIIQEEEPHRPSVRLSHLGEELADLAKRRNTDPKRLRQSIRGELDWIVMKSLEKDRRRRYESSTSLAADVQRFLNDDAVEACPPSVGYRFQKFARRNKVAFATGAIVAAALLFGIVGTTWQAIRATGAEGLAKTRLASKEQALLNADRSRQEMQEERDRAESLAERRRHLQYISDMNAAMVAWNENNISEFDRLLRSHMPGGDEADLRAWEWYYMWRLGEPYRCARRIDLPDIAQRLSLVPGTSLLAVSHGSHLRVTLWDTETPERGPESVFGSQEHCGWLGTPMAVSSDGDVVAVVATSNRQQLCLYDRQTEVSRRPITLENGAFNSVALTSASGYVAAGCTDGFVRVWSARSGELVREFPLGDPPPLQVSPAVTFSDDGSMLAAGGASGLVQVWEIPTWNKIHEHVQAGLIRSIAISPQNKYLAVASKSNLRLVELAEKQSEPTSLTGFSGAVYCVAFSPDGSLLASGGVDRTIRLWDTATRTLIGTLKGHWGSVRGLAFLPEQDNSPYTLASASLDQTVLLWDVKRDSVPREADVLTLEPEPYSAHLPNVAFVADTRLAVVSKTTVSLVDTDTLEIQDVAIKASQELAGVAVSPRGLLAAGGADGTVYLYDYIKDKEVPALAPEGLRGKVWSLAFAQDAVGCELLAAGTHSGEVRIWRRGEGKQWQAFDAVPSSVARNLPVASLSFAPDGKSLVLTTRRVTVLWDLVEKEATFLAKTGKCPSKIVFSPDGRTAAGGHPFKGLFLWDTQNIPAGPRTFDVPTRGLVFSEDGKTLFTAGNLNAIRVWDVATGRIRCTLKDQEGFSATSLALSPNGRTLAAGDAASHDPPRVLIWRTATANDARRAVP